jgi:hypothetical protein
MNPCRCSYLEKFIRMKGKAKKSKSILRKVFKRLKGIREG